MIIGISGKFGAGKDEACEVIDKTDFPERIWEERRLADLLKEVCAKLTGWDDQWSQDGKKHVLKHLGDISVGRVQQLVGEGMRELIDKDIWIKAALASKYDLENHFWLVPDVRYPNEADYIKSIGGVLLRINPSYEGYEEYVKSTGRDTNHISETALDDYPHFDYIIENNDSVQAFKREVKHFIKNIDGIRNIEG